MKVRFQADADLNQIIVLAVVRRAPSVDFRTASAAGLAGQNDAQVLARSAEEGRLLVTHDQTTMPEHFARFIGDHSSAGVLIAPQHVPPAVIAEDLLLIWHATEADEWTDRIIYLPL